MPVFTIPVDPMQVPLSQPDLGVAVSEWLTTHGYVVDGVTPQIEPFPALVIIADANPAVELAAWTPQASNARAKRQQAKQTFTQFSDAIGAAQTPTLAQTQKALMALGELVLYLAKDREP